MQIKCHSELLIILMFSGLFKKMLEMDECELIIKFHAKNQADLVPHMLILAKTAFVPKISQCPKNFGKVSQNW